MSKRIGSFEIVGRLDSRTGATSLLGRNANDGSAATIDIWKPESPDAQARFLRRAEACSRLEHDLIARILDFGIDGDTSCRIEEFVEGDSLAARIGAARIERAEELPGATVLDWLAQIARALEYAHGMGVAHGDLHPGTVTIRPGGTAKLRGFANPRATGEARYRAPELVRGGAPDAAADLYAFGALLHLLTCRNGAPCPRRLIPVIEGCRQEDPAKRHGSFGVIAGVIEDAIEDAIDDSAAAPMVPGAAAGDWASATMLANRNGDSTGEAAMDIPVRIRAGDGPPLIDIELAGGSRSEDVSGEVSGEAQISEEALGGNASRDSDGAPPPQASPPSLEAVAAAIRRPSRSRYRRRWLTFAAVAGTALWLGGTLWWSRGSPAVAGSDVLVTQTETAVELGAPAAGANAPVADPAPSRSGHAAAPPPFAAPAAPAAASAATADLAANPPGAVRANGRLALAPAWHPEITVSVAGGPPIVLDRRRVFEVEADVDHVLAFELATRDYQIREQVVTRVPPGRLLEMPVPLVRPGFLSVASVVAPVKGDDGAGDAGEAGAVPRPVFVRVGEEAVGWTPIARLQLPVGIHVLSLFENPTWRPEERIDQRIRVRSRQETTVQVDLVSEPPAVIVDGLRHEHAKVKAEAEAAPETSAP